jgi:eukaryotic-like serine/threonine-protein kinase
MQRVRGPGPSKIGKYRIIDLVGEGAMGVVYRAEDTVLNRTVAVKIMSESVALQPELRDRFLREAQLAGSLTHPNIVTVYDFGETEGHLFIAMEFVSGTDLETVLARRDPLKLQAKLEIMIDVLNALAHAHKRGIVHRDVKPANIRITEDGHAKLMDFGVAHLQASTITRTGSQMGTPSYMAPEQVAGSRVTPAADIFAAGTVLYELLTGSRPFGGPTLHSVMYRILNDEPPPLAELVPGLPSELEHIVRRAMAKEIDDRYQSALEMAAALTAVRASLSGGGFPGTLSLRTPVAVERRARPAQLLPWAGGALGMLAVGVLVWALASRAAPVANSPVANAPVAASHSTASGETAPPAATPSAATSATPTTPAPPPASRAPAADSPRDGRSTKAPRSRADDASAQRNARPPAATPSVPPQRAPAGVRTDSPAAGASARQTPASPPPLTSPSVVVAPASESAPRPAASAPPTPPSAAPDASRIPEAIDAYARAIETRALPQLRQAYPGLTAEQERSFAGFFDATRAIRVTFSIAGLEVNGATAEVRVVGTYEFVTTAGQTERKPVTFQATLRHDSGRWRLTSVR